MNGGILACGMLYLSVAAAPILAQTVTGTITGWIKDPQGAAVMGAQILAKNVDTGVEASTTTQDEGFYRLSNLVPGEYVIEIVALGFRKTILTAERVSVGEALRLDANVEIGPVSEAITVEAAATTVDTDNGQLGTTVRDIPKLPLLSGAGGRNPLALAAIIPGVGVNIGTGQPGNFSVNGQRFYSNNFFFDGGDANNQVVGVADNSVFAISPNALSEFRLVTGAMKAEFGRNSGAVVMVTPKSGTNSWHGGASETFRNSKLNAVPFFQNSIPGGHRKGAAQRRLAQSSVEQ